MTIKNTQFLIIVSILITLFLLTNFTAAADHNFINKNYLISAEEVQQLLEEEKENLKIIDVRNSAKYLLGHLPQSVHMWDDDFFDAEGWVKDLIPKPAVFAATVREKGIDNDSEIIVYDDNNSLWAARLWWIFRVYDHQNIKILEGGYDGWKNKGYESKMLPYKPQNGNFVVRDVKNDWIVNSDTVAENINNENFITLDTRSEAEFLGDETNSGAPRKGRIPKSINIEWTAVLNDNNSFKSAAEIAKIYEAKGITKDKENIAILSHNGTRAAHTFFTLKLIGYKNLKLYDESWVGWSSRSDLPIEKN